MVQNYELIFVLRPDLEEADTEKAVDRFLALIENHGGTAHNVDKWGKRKLAYEVKGYREGYYVVVNFSGDAALSAELTRVLRIADDVIRHLLVREGEDE